MKKCKLEICIGTLDDVVALKEYNVDRIECTSALELGGLTPTVAMVKQIKAMTSIEIVAMVRPHADGFVYSSYDVNCMFDDAKTLCEAGVEGIVFGFLDKEHIIDKALTKKMVDLVHHYKKQAIFHKAFDHTPDIFKAFDVLVDANVDRVLTEGGFHFDAITKLENLRTLINQNKPIEVLIGGGVRAENVLDILSQTGCLQVHSSCKSTIIVDGVSLVYVDIQKVKEMVDTLTV